MACRNNCTCGLLSSACTRDMPHFISYPSSHQPCLDLPLATHLASATDQDSRWIPPSSHALSSNSFPITTKSSSAPPPLLLSSLCRLHEVRHSELGPETHWHRLRLGRQFQSPCMHAHMHVRTHPCKICLIYPSM